MASALGSALMSLSGSIPGISKSFQDEEDRRLQREAGLLNLAKLRRENSQGEFEQRQRDIVSKNLDQYQKDVSEMDTVPQMMEAGPLPPDQYKRADELTKFKEMSPLGRLQSKGLIRGSAYSPEAERVVETILSDQKTKDKSTGMLSTYYKQKYDDEVRSEMFKHPDWSEDQIHARVMDNFKAGNFMVQTDPENLPRSTQLSEAKKLGGLTPKVIRGEGDLAGTKASASTTAREAAVRRMQKSFPMLNESQRSELSDSYVGINAVNSLIKKLEDGDLGYFDLNRKTGQFTNPEAEQAYSWLTEIIGRARSGAAINIDEWKSFKNQVLNPNKLLTDQGRIAALNTLRDRLKTPMFAKGASVVGNEEWYNDFEGIGRRAEANVAPKGEKDNDDPLGILD